MSNFEAYDFLRRAAVHLFGTNRPVNSGDVEARDILMHAASATIREADYSFKNFVRSLFR